MQALVTLLPEPYYQAVEGIWTELDAHFGCQHTFIRPKPHFTWQFADSYDEAYAQTLSILCTEIKPIEVQTDIVSRFSDKDPVMFLRIVPTTELLALHQQLWEALSPYWHNPSLFYQPGEWIPHITLSMNDTSMCDLEAAARFLNQKDLCWKFEIDRLMMFAWKEGFHWADEKEFLFGG
jgi:hypothetical protein